MPARPIRTARGKRQAVDQEIHTDLGGRITRIWPPRADGTVSILDLLGPGITLLTGPRERAWAVTATTGPDRPPIDVHHLDAIAARSIGVHGDGALLTRPDGGVIGWWAHAVGAAYALRDIGACSATTRARRRPAVAGTRASPDHRERDTRE